MNTRKFVRLNFYPITPQEFKFELWKQEYQDKKTEDLFQDLHRYRLPIKDGLDEYKDHWISFEPTENLERFVCKENYNHFLTQHYLHHLLVRKIENSLSVEDYIVQEGYRKLVYFVYFAPFKIKKDEIKAINSAIEGLKTDERFSDIDFVVLKINTDNNKFFGYAYTNSLVPYESTYTKLSNNPPSYLVWFEGLQYHRELIHKRISGPVLIEFYWNNRELTENERIKYLG